MEFAEGVIVAQVQVSQTAQGHGAEFEGSRHLVASKVDLCGKKVRVNRLITFFLPYLEHVIDASAGQRIGEIVDRVPCEIPLFHGGADQQGVGHADKLVEAQIDARQQATFAQLDRQP